jgi:hypothetical protein
MRNKQTVIVKEKLEEVGFSVDLTSEGMHVLHYASQVHHIFTKKELLNKKTINERIEFILNIFLTNREH